MKIAVHAEELNRAHADGTHQYIEAVLEHSGALRGSLEACVRAMPPKKCRADNTTYKVLPWQLPAWTETAFAWHVYQSTPDVCWVPLQHLPRLRSRRTKYVVTVHDLGYLHTPESFAPKVQKALQKKTAYAVEYADALICVSENTRRDIEKYFPQHAHKSSVVHHGWQKPATADQAILTKHHLVAGQYYCTLNTITHPRKGIVTLIDAFEKLAAHDPQAKLLIAGRDGYRASEVRIRTEASAYKERIIFTGAVSEAEKAALLGHARVFVYPSLYEGFGMSVLEALAVGTSVVAADNSSLLEVGGEAVKYFATDNAADLARVLQDTESVAKHVVQEQLAQFSWERCAKETQDVFASVF